MNKNFAQICSKIEARIKESFNRVTVQFEDFFGSEEDYDLEVRVFNLPEEAEADYFLTLSEIRRDILKPAGLFAVFFDYTPEEVKAHELLTFDSCVQQAS